MKNIAVKITNIGWGLPDSGEIVWIKGSNGTAKAAVRLKEIMSYQTGFFGNCLCQVSCVANADVIDGMIASENIRDTMGEAHIIDDSTRAKILSK